VFRAARFSELIATDCSILGRVVSRARRHEEAVQLLTDAIELAEQSGAQLLRVGTLGFLAEDLVLQGDADGALATLERARSQADLIGGAGVYEPLLDRVKGCAHLIRGELDEATDAVGRGLAAARSAESGFELLMLLRLKRAIAHRRGDVRSEADEAEVRSIAEGLGIVSIPEPLVLSTTP
jgi:ATP/maltotriose-dependent transcriptional regulator MalT